MRRKPWQIFEQYEPSTQGGWLTCLVIGFAVAAALEMARPNHEWLAVLLTGPVFGIFCAAFYGETAKNAFWRGHKRALAEIAAKERGTGLKEWLIDHHRPADEE